MLFMVICVTQTNAITHCFCHAWWAVVAEGDVMRVRSSVPVLIISMLMSGPGLADDVAQPQLTPAAAAFLADLERSSRWQLAEYSLPIRQTDGFIRPLPDVEFEDNGLLDRIRKLRRVSFLTLAEIVQAQLFFGVNDKGLVGFHFNDYRNRGKGRQLEMLRMPYLLADDEESNK